MAEILFAAKNLDTGYIKGDPISVMPDGTVWGNLDGPNNPPNAGGEFAVLQIPGMTVAKVQNHIGELWEDAIPGDPEFDAPDPADRRIRRHRRANRLIWDEVPAQKISNLLTFGIASATEAQVKAVYRKLAYNRTSGQVEETTTEVF